jgi:hypothetical protein
MQEWLDALLPLNRHAVLILLIKSRVHCLIKLLVVYVTIEIADVSFEQRIRIHLNFS